MEFGEKSLSQVEEQTCKKHSFRPEKIVVEIFGNCKKRVSIILWVIN